MGAHVRGRAWVPARQVAGEGHSKQRVAGLRCGHAVRQARRHQARRRHVGGHNGHERQREPLRARLRCLGASQGADLMRNSTNACDHAFTHLLVHQVRDRRALQEKPLQRTADRHLRLPALAPWLGRCTEQDVHFKQLHME